MKPKILIGLVAATAVAVVAAVIATRPQRPSESGPGATAGGGGADLAQVIGPLKSRVSDVAAVHVRSATGETNIELAEGQWRIREKSGYPVEQSKINDLLRGLAGLRNLEAMTRLPERHKSLGLEEPVKKEGAPETEVPRSLAVTIKDKSGQAITSVVVGNTKWSQTPGEQGIYLRKAGDNQTWYADGRLDVPREPLAWLKNEFADIARDRVRSVTITPRENVEADQVRVVREKPADGSFTVLSIPEGKQLKDTTLSEVVVAGLVKSTFEDVAPADAIDWSGGGADAGKGKPGSTAEVRTWDGLIVRVETAEKDGRQWWKLTALADPEPYLEVAPAPTPDPAPPAAEGSAAPATPAPEAKPRRTAEEVKKEVDELNARWSAWVFSPYSYKAGAFSKRLSEELKDPVPPAVPASAPSLPGTEGLPPMAPPQGGAGAAPTSPGP